MNGKKLTKRTNGILTSMNSTFPSLKPKKALAVIRLKKQLRARKTTLAWMTILKISTFLMTVGSKRKKMIFDRNYVSFPIKDNQIEFIKQQMLTWAAPFNICCFLDNHDYNSGTSSLHSVECLLAAGAAATLKASAGEGM